MENKIFTYDGVHGKLDAILDKIKAEYKSIHLSTLGGVERASIIITLSLDKRETWHNGILQNSRYYHFYIDMDGGVENFSCGYKCQKIRKKHVSTLNDAIDYINLKISKENITISDMEK